MKKCNLTFFSFKFLKSDIQLNQQNEETFTGKIKMYSTNIKVARMAIGLSLQELSERLTEAGHPTTKVTLSNYENGKYVPSEELLRIIARELRTTTAYFNTDIKWNSQLRFFHKSEMIDRTQQNLEAFISIELARFKYIDDLLGIKSVWKRQPKKLYSLDRPDTIENLAYQFRTDHGAGRHAIPSVCSMLESQGWHIFSIPDYCKQDKSISGYDETTGVPFILYKPDEYQDEMRLSLLKSVGYSLIEGETEEETEELVTHFARAVLLPENIVRYSFGDRRKVLTERELATAKRMYGIGKKYIVKRMNELGIIDDSLYSEYMAYISQRFDLVRSSGLTDDSRFYDVPTTYEMRVARANAEGLTSITSIRSTYGVK